MRWIALVDSPGHVCCRYRLKAFIPFFERTVILCTWYRYPIAGGGALVCCGNCVTRP